MDYNALLDKEKCWKPTFSSFPLVGKHCWKKEKLLVTENIVGKKNKMLVTSISSFSNNYLKPTTEISLFEPQIVPKI